MLLDNPIRGKLWFDSLREKEQKNIGRKESNNNT